MNINKLSISSRFGQIYRIVGVFSMGQNAAGISLGQNRTQICPIYRRYTAVLLLSVNACTACIDIWISIDPWDH